MSEKKEVWTDLTRPIKPDEVEHLKREGTPAGVFEVFNELIAVSYRDGRATIRQDVVVERIAQKLGVESHEIFAKGWLDVEVAYREQGWKVTYDKPGYNETYEAFFVFETSQKRSP